MRDSTGLDTGEKKKSLCVGLDLIYQWCPQCVQNSIEKGLSVVEVESIVLSSLSQTEKLFLCFIYWPSR